MVKQCKTLMDLVAQGVEFEFLGLYTSVTAGRKADLIPTRVLGTEKRASGLVTGRMRLSCLDIPFDMLPQDQGFAANFFEARGHWTWYYNLETVGLHFELDDDSRALLKDWPEGRQEPVKVKYAAGEPHARIDTVTQVQIPALRREYGNGFEFLVTPGGGLIDWEKVEHLYKPLK